MKNVLTIVTVLAFAACGSKKPAPTAPTEPEHHHDEGSGSAAATPDTAKEPDKPAEPPAEPKPDPKAQLLAAETAAWETAKPVFEKSCATCHTTAGKKSSKKKLDHFNFDTYPPGGHHTATIGFTIRDVLGISGKKPTMPYDKPGSVQGDDLAKIKAWTDAWEASHKGGAHEGHEGHDHHD